jgi:undecaprenyl-diphosphatase
LWNRDRPDLIANGIAAPGLHSFPSGHALVIITVYGLMAFLWWRAAHHVVEKGVAIAAFMVWIGMVSMARLVLGAHWLTDILASYLIGLTWLTVLIVALSQAEAAQKH